MAMPFAIVRSRGLDSGVDRRRLSAYLGRGAFTKGAPNQPRFKRSFGAQSAYAATLSAISNLPPEVFSGRDGFEERTAKAQDQNLRLAVLACLPSALSPLELRRLIRDWVACRITTRIPADAPTVTVTKPRFRLQHAHVICSRRG